jgi:hypothetical protein
MTGCTVLLQPTPKGDSYVQQLAREEDRPFSRYLLNRAGRDRAIKSPKAR